VECAAAGEDEVRVAVDEAGDDRPALGVNPRIGSAAGYLRARPGPGHDAAFEDHGCVADQPERALADTGIVGDL
jgi:hypothetical protein